MEGVGAIILAGFAASILPAIGGLLVFMRLSGKLEERIDGIRRDIVRLEDQLKTFGERFVRVEERSLRLEGKFDSYGERLDRFESRFDSFDQRLDRFLGEFNDFQLGASTAYQGLDERVSRLEEKLV